jgi:hypothetical protein
MGDIILLTYGHEHKHKQFIKFWREFRQRHPTAKNTPELARVEIYNLRFDDDPKDTLLVKQELNNLCAPQQESFFFLKRNGLIGKTFCKLFSTFFKRKFTPYEPVKGTTTTKNFGHFYVVPMFEKKDRYKWNNNEP